MAHDLDIYSLQFQRWGFLRWIWLPYQKNLRHRSFLSHGPIIGTTLRVVYLGVILIIVAILVLWVGTWWGTLTLDWQSLGLSLGRSLYSFEFLALFLGLELGAMSHSVSDGVNSAYKRMQKQGFRGLLNHGKIKKRKAKSNPKPRLKPKTSKTRTK